MTISSVGEPSPRRSSTHSYWHTGSPAKLIEALIVADLVTVTTTNMRAGRAVDQRGDGSEVPIFIQVPGCDPAMVVGTDV